MSQRIPLSEREERGRENQFCTWTDSKNVDKLVEKKSASQSVATGRKFGLAVGSGEKNRAKRKDMGPKEKHFEI